MVARTEEDAAPLVSTAGAGAAPRRMITVPRGGHMLSLHPSELDASTGMRATVDLAVFAPALEFLRARAAERP